MTVCLILSDLLLRACNSIKEFSNRWKKELETHREIAEKPLKNGTKNMNDFEQNTLKFQIKRHFQ